MNKFFATATSALVLGFTLPAMAGDSNSTLTQFGYYNGASVEQIGETATNDSTIRQGLINNLSTGNGASVYQDGTHNQKNNSAIDQDGSYNSTSVVQGGVGTIGDTNNSTVDQDGDSNSASVNQANVQHDNNSTVTQLGTSNWATVDQGGPEGNNVGNDSIILQTGYGNQAHVHQGGDHAKNDSTITQDDPLLLGGQNYASVSQYADSENNSEVTQHGLFNAATVTQGAASGVVNNSNVTQTGEGNSANVNQH